MNTIMWTAPLVAAGRPVDHAGELVRRHLGLSTPVEHWAAPLYDAPSKAPGVIDHDDLLATAALGVRITRQTLTQFHAALPALNAWLGELPADVSLADADDDLVDRVAAALSSSELEPTTTAKLLHRARPRLVPPYDRAVSDWYARALCDRGAGRPPTLLYRLRSDLANERNHDSLVRLQQLAAAASDGGLVRSRLRLFDIAVWMAANDRT
ncbi:MAG: DUF6308 family protein [Actinomycetota bacterium]|jgi:hypothetical protein|nr:DUF6308 family protein [Actinomycetota bacterium]